MTDRVEIWGNIPGLEGFYQASTLGRIRSLDRYVHHNKGKQLKKSTILKPAIDRIGYVNVALSINNKLSSYKVHRLVAMSFIENPNGLCEVNHKDCDKGNNAVWNLEWCSHQQNINHAVKNNRITYHRGENHKASKLTNIQRKEIKAMRESGMTLQAIAANYPVHLGTISKICKS